MVKPALPTLVKLATQKVEQAQQALAANRELQADVKGQIQHWHQTAAAAFQDGAAEDSVVMMKVAGTFQHRANLMIRGLEHQLAELVAIETTLRTTLNQAFTKQKRFEILAEQQAQAAKLAAQKKAQAALDESAKRR